MSDKNENIDDLIKEGFNSSDDGFDFDSWKGVEQKLDHQAGLDAQIVQAFNLATDEMPVSAWPDIEEELDVNTVWNRINYSFNKKKRRIVFWWNSAAIALIIFIAGFTSYQEYKKYNENSFAFSHVLTENENNSSNSESNQLDETLEENLVNNTVSEHHENKRIQNSGTEPKDENLDLSPLTLLNKNVDQTIKYPIDLTENLLENKVKLDLVEPFPLGEIALIEMNNVEHDEPEIEITPKDAQNLLRPRKWVMGAFGSINNSIISDATAREAFSRNSLSSNNFTLTFNYGIFAQLFVADNFFFQTELYYNAKSKRSTQEYQHFEYVKHNLELDYYQLSFLFGKSFAIGNNGNCWLNPALGVFGSVLKQGNEYVEDGLLANYTPHKRTNFGLQFNLGIQHEFDRFIIGYGTNSNFGLSNIFSGTEQQSSVLNISRTISNGIYLKLGYKF